VSIRARGSSCVTYWLHVGTEQGEVPVWHTDSVNTSSCRCHTDSLTWISEQGGKSLQTEQVSESMNSGGTRFESRSVSGCAHQGFFRGK
jgi:hypothetical protein